ncbi:MAG: hypothetical protein ACSHYA_18615 [Opitutaceae bacterium]
MIYGSILLALILSVLPAVNAVERLIDTPVPLEEILERKEHLIGARVAIAAYINTRECGRSTPRISTSDDHYSEENCSIGTRQTHVVSYFSKDGEKRFLDLEFNRTFPALIYGTVKRGTLGTPKKLTYTIELHAVYEVSPENPDWLKAQKKLQIDRIEVKQ